MASSIDSWGWVSDLLQARQDELQARYAHEIELAAQTWLASGQRFNVHDNRGRVVGGPLASSSSSSSSSGAAGVATVASLPVSTFRDPTVQHLRALVPEVARRAYELVRRARLAGLPLYISSSVRTQAQQDELVRRGASQTRASLHLVGRAFDVDLKGYHRDRVPSRVWQWLGALGEALGFEWGGRWRTLRDFGHFEYRGFGGGGFRSGGGF